METLVDSSTEDRSMHSKLVRAKVQLALNKRIMFSFLLFFIFIFVILYLHSGRAYRHDSIHVVIDLVDRRRLTLAIHVVNMSLQKVCDRKVKVAHLLNCELELLFLDTCTWHTSYWIITATCTYNNRVMCNYTSIKNNYKKLKGK